MYHQGGHATTRLVEVLKIGLEKVLKRALRRCLAEGFRGRKALRRGSKKVLRGRNTPFREYHHPVPKGPRGTKNTTGSKSLPP